jgi:hypothetical protein
LSEAIAQVLTTAGGAMNVWDIAETVRAGGYLRSPGRGMYQLNTAAGGTSKVRKARRRVQRKK